MLSRIAESLYWVGRYVERAEDTARILDVHVHHHLEDPSVDEEPAGRGLLDSLFPRSALHALGEAEGCLAEPDPDSGRAGAGGEARRVVGRARTDLESVTLSQLMADLPGNLTRFQLACLEAGNNIASRFFRAVAEIDVGLEWAGAR